MARYGGTLTADVNSAAAPERADRLSITIENLSTGTDTIHVEFGQAAATAPGTGCWVVFPGSALSLVQGEYPEIRGSVNLISAGTPSYIIRDN